MRAHNKLCIDSIREEKPNIHRKKNRTQFTSLSKVSVIGDCEAHFMIASFCRSVVEHVSLMFVVATHQEHRQ